VQEVCGLLLKLYALRQPLLSRYATDALTAVCGRESSLPQASLVELLRAVVQSESVWDTKDLASTLALIQLVEAGYLRYGGLSQGLSMAAESKVDFLQSPSYMAWDLCVSLQC